MSTIVTPIFYMETLKYREVIQLARGHTATKWQSWDVNPCSQSGESTVGATIPPWFSVSLPTPNPPSSFVPPSRPVLPLPEVTSPYLCLSWIALFPPVGSPTLTPLV